MTSTMAALGPTLPSAASAEPGSYRGISCRQWGQRTTAEDVKVFGRRPPRTFPHAPRPASENLQRTKPREGARIWRCRALSDREFAVAGPHLTSAAHLPP